MSRNISTLLEIAVFNAESAIRAAEVGADRLELCENPLEGGTTPSYGTLKTVRAVVGIPVFPIIRPRGGDFLYDQWSFEAMEKDIALCKQLGFEGVVTGLLLPDGSIDERRTARLADLAYPMELTFHRAFDRAEDPFKALEAVIRCGCNRVLTSGQQPLAWDGKELIRELVSKADARIIVMPGSGVRSSHIQMLAEYTGAAELHSSARTQTPSRMHYTKPSMEEALLNTGVDEQEIINMKKACTLLEAAR